MAQMALRLLLAGCTAPMARTAARGDSGVYGVKLVVS